MNSDETYQDDTHEHPSMEVTIVYEDLPAGLRAKDMMDQIFEQAQSSVGAEMQMHLWKMDLLRIASLEEQAVHDAVASQIVVVSLGDRGDFTLPARHWIRDWGHHRKASPCALVVLFDERHLNTIATRRLLGYLQEFAREADLNFFTEGVPKRDTNQESIAQIRHRTQSSSPTLEGILKRQTHYRRWGINE